MCVYTCLHSVYTSCVGLLLTLQEFPWVPEVDKVSSVNEQNNVIPLKAISSELLKVYIEGARFLFLLSCVGV